jgi:glyoxylase-like metal-dependent hydrolase (beta-lactamase superfamily II)
LGINAEPVEVVDGIFRVDAPLGERVVSLYVIKGDDEVVIFDSGIDGTIPKYLSPHLKKLGIKNSDVSTVVISHCDVDHYGGVSDCAEIFGDARILAHPYDAREIEDFDVYLANRGRGFKEDYGLDEDDAVIDWSRSVTRERLLHGTITDGEVLSVGGRQLDVWHVPGHSRGHLALSVPDSRALIISDAVLGEAVLLADGSPAFPPTYRYLDEYRSTIHRVKSGTPELLLTAHYPTLHGGAATDFLDLSLQFTNRLHVMVLEKLGLAGDSGLSLWELVSALNPEAGSWPNAGTAKALAFPVAGHLEHLINNDQAVRVGVRDGVSMWRLA